MSRSTARTSIARVSEEGSISTVAQGGLLQNPAEVRFGVSENEETPYITNYAVFRFLGLTPGPPRPALLSLAVDDDEETDEEDD